MDIDQQAAALAQALTSSGAINVEIASIVPPMTDAEVDVYFREIFDIFQPAWPPPRGAQFEVLWTWPDDGKRRGLRGISLADIARRIQARIDARNIAPL